MSNIQHCYILTQSISPVRSNSGPMPAGSSHASRPSFDQMKLEIIKRMQKADKTKSDVRSAVRASNLSFSASSSSNLGFVP